MKNNNKKSMTKKIVKKFVMSDSSRISGIGMMEL